MDGLCERCDADARRAFEALGAIGAAVAVGLALANAAYAKDQDWLGDPETARSAWAVHDEALAALCGVDVDGLVVGEPQGDLESQ